MNMNRLLTTKAQNVIDASRVQESSEPKITNQNSFSIKWEIKLWNLVEKQSEIIFFLALFWQRYSFMMTQWLLLIYSMEINFQSFSEFLKIYSYIVCSDLSSFPLISSQCFCYCTLAFFRCQGSQIKHYSILRDWLFSFHCPC